jgi:archaeosine synthase
MARTVDWITGLACAGSASVGPFLLSPPELWFAAPDPGGEAGPFPAHPFSIRSVEAPPAHRAFSVTGPTAEMRVQHRIPAPEVSGIAGSIESSGDRAVVVHAPLSEGDWNELRRIRPEFVVLGNARVLFQEGGPFVSFVGELRRHLGPEPVLWAPRTALPHRIPLLVYLGVDILDTTEGRIRELGGDYLDPQLGTLEEKIAMARRRCRCPACSADPPGSRAAHTEWLYLEEMALSQTALRTGRLRELVEARVTAEPLLAEILRYSDRDLGDLLEERTPVVEERSRSYVLRESQRRPEILRFRRRLIDRYRPPPSKRTLLLVPCSRTKPYRNSRSHRRFASALEGLASREQVHIVSVTSPLGLVPRELEDVYPARHYDIPVTGDWDEGERRAVSEALGHLRRTGAYSQVIVHLDPEEYAFLRPELRDGPPSVWTLTDHGATRPEAIDALRAAVVAALDPLPPVAGGPMAVVREELAAVAAFQFGTDAARLLFAAPVRLAGRPWFQRVTDGHGVDLATWREERGLFQLTVPGALRMLAAHPLEVQVTDGLELTGDLFAPGVKAADPDIRVGDAVTLVRDGRLLGVGEALLPASFMTGVRRGAAVRVRHRNHSMESSVPPTAT